jgi:hypothetical protein
MEEELYNHLLYRTSDLESLEEHKSIIDWALVSSNENIIWDKKIIVSFESYLDWDMLISNPSIDIHVNWKDSDLLLLAHQHQKLWDVFDKKNIIWTKEDYFKLKGHQGFREIFPLLQRLFLQRNIEWTLKEFIEEYDAYKNNCGPFIDYDYNSFSGDVKEIKGYNSLTSFEEFLNELDTVFERYWGEYTYSEDVFIKSLIDFNHKRSTGDLSHSGLNLTEKDNDLDQPFMATIENSVHLAPYKKWNWKYLSKSAIVPWSLDVIQRFSLSWHWKLLLQNENIQWSENNLCLFLDQVNKFTWENNFEEEIKINAWNGLLLNRKIQIRIDFLHRQGIQPNLRYFALNEGGFFSKDHLKYLHDDLIPLISDYDNDLIEVYRKDFFGNLHKNKTIKWTYEILSNYKELLNWNDWITLREGKTWKTRTLSRLDTIKYSHNFINRFSDVLDFKFLSSYENVEWSMELIQQYEKLWNWELLKENTSIPWQDFQK